MDNQIIAVEDYLDKAISLVAAESLLRGEIKKTLSSSVHQLTLEGTVKKRYFQVPKEVDQIEMDAKALLCSGMIEQTARVFQLFN